MSLSRVGYFEELTHGAGSGQFLRDAVRPEAGPREEQILHYLQTATVRVVGCVAHMESNNFEPPELHDWEEPS